MEEEDIGDDLGHDGFGGSSADAVHDAGAHEGAVGVCLGAPDGGSEVDELREEVHWATTER